LISVPGDGEAFVYGAITIVVLGVADLLRTRIDLRVLVITVPRLIREALRQLTRLDAIIIHPVLIEVSVSKKCAQDAIVHNAIAVVVEVVTHFFFRLHPTDTLTPHVVCTGLLPIEADAQLETAGADGAVDADTHAIDALFSGPAGGLALCAPRADTDIVRGI
jgi:hypothetical protein